MICIPMDPVKDGCDVFLVDFSSHRDSWYELTHHGRFRKMSHTAWLGLDTLLLFPSINFVSWRDADVCLRPARRSGPGINQCVSVSCHRRISSGRYIQIQSCTCYFKFRLGHTRGRVVEAINFPARIALIFCFIYLLRYVFTRVSQKVSFVMFFGERRRMRQEKHKNMF
jgi:hypothetical protein